MLALTLMALTSVLGALAIPIIAYMFAKCGLVPPIVIEFRSRLYVFAPWQLFAKRERVRMFEIYGGGSIPVITTAAAVISAHLAMAPMTLFLHVGNGPVSSPLQPATGITLTVTNA